MNSPEPREDLDEGVLELHYSIPVSDEIERIYEQNARTAMEAKRHLSRKVVLDDENLVNSDFEVLTVNFQLEEVAEDLENKIADKIKQTIQRKADRVQELREDYEARYSAWLEKTRNSSSSVERIAELPPKQVKHLGGFPQVTTETQSGIGFRRGVLSDSVRTEAEFQAVLELLGGEGNVVINNEERNKLAEEPDMVQGDERELMFYDDMNTYVPDFEDSYKDHSNSRFSVWLDEEKEIFYREFLLHGKDFSKISSRLKNKSVCDCVHYYYREKIRLSLSRLARKSLKQRKKILGSRIMSRASPQTYLMQEQVGNFD